MTITSSTIYKKLYRDSGWDRSTTLTATAKVKKRWVGSNSFYICSGYDVLTLFLNLQRRSFYGHLQKTSLIMVQSRISVFNMTTSLSRGHPYSRRSSCVCFWALKIITSSRRKQSKAICFHNNVY